MSQIDFAPAARRDLAEIWFYTFNRWGEAQADNYTAAIHAALDFAMTNGANAQSIDNVRPGYWRIKAGHHLCFFTRAGDEGIIVMRILHERMDAAKHL